SSGVERPLLPRGEEMKRIVIGAIAGAVIIFIWGAFSHMVLLIGVGFTPLPSEDRVLAELRGAIPKEGLYFSQAQISGEPDPTTKNGVGSQASYRADWHADIPPDG